MLLLGVQFLNSFAFGSLTSLFVFFAAAVLDLDAQSAVLLFASFIVGTLASPFWTFLARRFGNPPLVMAVRLLIVGQPVATFAHRHRWFGQAVAFSIILRPGFVLLSSDLVIVRVRYYFFIT